MATIALVGRGLIAYEAAREAYNALMITISPKTTLTSSNVVKRVSELFHKIIHSLARFLAGIAIFATVLNTPPAIAGGGLYMVVTAAFQNAAPYLGVMFAASASEHLMGKMIDSFPSC